MIDIAPVLSPITMAAEREFSELDPLVEQMITHADHSRFLPAAELAEQLWRQQIHDVRILGFYLFGAFLENGLPVLPQILTGVVNTLAVNWPFLGPKDNKQRHCDVALRWLFTNILGQLRFYHRSQGEGWQTRLQQWEAAPQRQILQRTGELGELLLQTLHAGQAQGQLLALRTFLQALPIAPVDPATTPAAEEAEKDAQRASAASSQSAGADEDVAVRRAAGSEARSTAAPAALLALPISPPLELLLRKLDAFNRLVALGKWRQAVIVYKDIETCLQSFDPRRYLPTLFGEFSKNVFVHADKIGEGLNLQVGFAEGALASLYSVDLDLFIAAKG